MGALAVVLALLASALPAAAQGGDGPGATEDRGDTSAPRQPEGPMLLLRSITGIRDGAPTVLGGAVLNQGGAPADATVVIEDLPRGAAIAAVRPQSTAPEDGLAWRCDGSTCQLLDASGAPAELPAATDVPLVLALSGDLSAAQGTLHVRVGGSAAVGVPLERDDGAAPLARDALSVAPSGTGTLAPGGSADSTVTVANLASGPLVAGSITLDRSGGPAGASATLAGEGWSCGGPTCTYARALAPLELTPPITVTTTADAAAPDAEAEVTYTASASLGPGRLSATASVPLVIAEPAAQGVSVSVQLRQSSVSPPAEVIADVRVAALGLGTLRAPAQVRIETPDGVSVDWDRVEVPEPWTCAAATSSCRSEGPLLTGAPSVLPLPLRVTTDAAQGTARIEAAAGLVDERGEPIGDEDRAGAGLVVNPPPVAELRATMRAADGTTPVRGEPIVFSADEPRDVVVTVTNQGSRAAAEGSEVEVQLQADPVQRVRSAGGEGWTCDRRRSVGVDEPFRCHTTLDEDLPSGGSVEMPLQLDPATGGSSEWTVRSGRAGEVSDRSDRRVRIDVGALTPSLTPRVQVVRELERGATGEVTVTLDNRGDGVARGGLLVLDVPGGLRATSSAGEGWSCVDTSLLDARGSFTCTYGVDVEPGEHSSALELELVTDRSSRSLPLWAWATAPGQVPQARSGVLTELDVHDGRTVDAGPDLTVVTPVRGVDGVERPAVVQLDGRVPGGFEGVRWVQRCTQPGEQDCDRVQPAVTWLGVEPGREPDQARARFVAPAELSAPVTLQFELQAERAGRVRSDRVQVRLVPTRVAGAAVERGGAGRTDAGGSRDDAASGGTSAGTASAGTTPTAPADVGVTIGDGSVLQVATRTDVVLSARASGAAPFSYSWRQTSGASASIAGGTDGSQLVFEAPDLAPEDNSEQLGFEVTVTDAEGHTANATAAVQVVWGDDGLQVQLAGGAASVVATVDTPLTVTSTVTSAGAPYTYDWSLDGEIELPEGTAVDGADLSFTAPAGPGTGTAQLKVTDSFGRVTVESVPISVTELPAGEVPAALCSALGELESGTAAQLGGDGVSVVIPAAGARVNGVPAPGPAPSSSTTTSSSSTTTTTSSSTTTVSSSTTTSPTTTPVTSSTTTTTVPDCAVTAGASFTGATATLPGGLSVTGAAGELTVAGVTLTGGTVMVPGNWGQLDLDLPGDGLMVPFVSSTALGVPTGALEGEVAPLVDLADWDLSTSVAFADQPRPAALVSAVGSPSTGSGSWSLRGTAVDDGATNMTLSATGLVALGPLDVPVVGQLSTDGPAAPVISTVSGSVDDRPLATDVVVEALDVDWSPSAVTGSFSLGLGPDGALELIGTATFPTPTSTSGQVTLDVPAGPSVWAPGGASGPQLVMSGSGTVEGDELDLSVAATPVAPWQPARATLISGLAAAVRADCELDGDQACAPTIGLSGTLDARPVAAAPVPLTGSMDTSSGVTTLRATPGALGVAPVRVDDAAWSAVFDPTGVTVQATGTATVLGSDRGTTVHFGDDVVVAEADLGERTLVPGWSVQGAVALAADATTAYPFAAAQRSGTVQVVAGQLIGAGATELPAALAEGVLPPSLQGGVVTFPITASSAGPYRLSLVDDDGWNVTPEAGTLAELTISSIDMEITADGQQADVALTGAAGLRATGIDGAVLPALPLLLTGSLTSDDGEGTLSANLTNSSWPSPLAFPGLDVAALSVALSVTPTATTAALGGTASLAPALSGALGAPAGPLAVSGALNVPTPALVVDLAQPAGWAVNPGGSGLLATDDARLVLAPSDDTTVGGDTVGRGATLLATLASGDALQLPIDPTDLTLGGTAQLGSVVIGGASMTDVVVDVADQQLRGSVTIDTTSLPVTGTISLAATGAPFGQVDLELTSPGTTIQLGGRSLQVSALELTPWSVLGPGAPSVTLSTSVPAFGSSVVATLSGAMVAGSLVALSGTVPPATYTLSPTDTLTTGLQVTLGPPPGPSPSPAPGWVLSISTYGAPTLVADGYEFTSLAAQVGPDGEQFQFTGSVALPGSAAPGVQMSGTYITGGSSGGTPGTFSATAPSEPTLTLAGFAVSGTPTIGRSNGELSATFKGTTSFGLLDGDTAVPLTGTFEAPATDGGSITTTLTGQIGATSLRGLAGEGATFEIRQGPNPLRELGGYITDVTFLSAQDSCSFWDGAPTFRGATYRDSGTTYYTLTATVDLTWPSGLAVSVPWGQYPQPVALSNENVPGTQPAPGLTLQAGFAASTFTAMGMFAFDPVACSFSVGGTLVLEWVGGSQSGALAQNTQQGPILQLSQSQFGAGNSVPESIQVVRNELRANQLAAQLAQDAQDVQSLSELAQERLELANRTLSSFLDGAAQARSALSAANDRLAAATAEATAASTSLEQAQARASVAGAQQEVTAASARVATAGASLQAATAEQAEAQARSSVADDMVSFAKDNVEEAADVLGDAQQDLQTAQQQQEQEQAQAHASPVMLTLDWTHCDTCEEIDVFNVDGEIIFGNKIIVGADVDFSWGEEFVVDGSFTLGYQWLITAGYSRLYAQGQAVLEGTVDFGYTEGDGWDELGFDIEGQATLSVYLSLWFATYSATLAEITAQIGVQAIPSPATFSGSVTVDIFGLTPTFGFGPDEL